MKLVKGLESDINALGVTDRGEVIRALAIGSAISAVLDDVPMAISGAALGLALGDWLAAFLPNDPKAQEGALDRILVIAARGAGAAEDA
jgi:hypothetical protein